MTRIFSFLLLLGLGGSLFWPTSIEAQTGIIDDVMNSFSSGGDNLSTMLLSRIFGCQLFDHPTCRAGQEPALVGMIRIFNILCISLAGVLFGWYAATGITQTAHEGKVLGARYSSLWAPVRSLVGLGMLMPIGGSSGYNTIQMGIAVFVKGSTFAASLLWGQAADRIITFQDTYILPDTSFDASVIEPLWEMEVCAAMISHLLEPVDNGSTLVRVERAENCYLGEDGEDVCYVTVKPYGNVAVINANNLNRTDGCGVLTLPDIPTVLTGGGNPSLGLGQGLDRQYRDIHLNAIEDVVAVLRPQAEHLVAHVRRAPANQDPARVAGLASAIREAGTSYSNTLNRGLNPLLDRAGALGTGDGTNARDRLSLIVAGAYSSACRHNSGGPYGQEICLDRNNQGQGWLGAGAWYMHMARFADDGLRVKNSRPTFQAADLGNTNIKAHAEANDTPVLTRFWSFLFGSYERSELIEEARRISREMDQYWKAAWISAVNTGTIIPAEMIRGTEGTEIGATRLRDRMSRFIWEFLQPDPDGDPMIGLAGLGSILTETGGYIIGGSAVGQTLGYLLPGIGGSIIGVGNVVQPIGFAILMVGQTLTTIMPVLPSLIWVAAVTGYFLIIAEAIISVNLWAIMHFRLEGEGLAGPATQQGYLLVMSLALTPVLMVFGFILGMGIFKITTTLVNIGFYVVLDGVMQSQSVFVWGTGLLLVGILMVVVYFILAERSFSLTAELPGRILRWVGGDSQLLGGEADRIRVATAGAGHQVMSQGQQAFQTIGSKRRRTSSPSRSGSGDS